MKEMKAKLQQLIEETQKREDVTSNGGGYLIIATAPNDNDNQELLCALQGKHIDIVDMLIAVLKDDPKMKKILMDALMFDVFTHTLGKSLERDLKKMLDEEKERGCADCKCKDQQPGTDVE